jgi:hypothetical protein
VTDAATLAQPQLKIPFKNVHAQAAPAFAIMQLTGSVVEDGVTFLQCTQPTTSQGTEYAINGPVQVAAGAKGICFRDGDVQVAFDTGTPQPAQTWGPRATQWTLSKGYPAVIEVHGISSDSGKVLFGRLQPLVALMGSSTSSLTALSGTQPGTQSMTLQAWDGTNFNASSPTTAFTGYNISPNAIAANTITQFVNVNGIWLATGGAGDNGFEVVKTTQIHPSATVHTVNIWTGTPGSEVVSSPLRTLQGCNRTSVLIPSNKFCLATKIGGNWYIEPWEC